MAGLAIIAPLRHPLLLAKDLTGLRSVYPAATTAPRPQDTPVR
jgi:hypothetical protein